jgi:hypothetical protein
VELSTHSFSTSCPSDRFRASSEQNAPSFTRTWIIIRRTSVNTIILDYAAKLNEPPNEYLADAMPIAKQITAAQGLENYSILQVLGACPIRILVLLSPFCFIPLVKLICHQE